MFNVMTDIFKLHRSVQNNKNATRIRIYTDKHLEEKYKHYNKIKKQFSSFRQTLTVLLFVL